MSSVLNAGKPHRTTIEESDELLVPELRARSTPRPLSLRRNFSFTLAGNAVYAGCQWGMLIVVAKLGSPELVGQFALGLAVTGPVLMFTNLHLRAVQATDARREYRFGHYLALRLITTLIASIVIAAVASRYRTETAVVILAVGLAKVFESLSDVVYGLMQAHERLDRIAVSMMIKGVLSLVALGVTVYLTGSIAWGALALACGWGLLLIAYDVPNGLGLLKAGENFRPRWDFPGLARLTLLALPLGLVMTLISLNTNIPRYFIDHERGERELGIFAALAYLMVGGGTVIAAMGQSATPRLARYYAEGDDRSFTSLLATLVGVAAAIGIAGFLVALIAGRLVLGFLYTPAYADHSGLFTWLMLAAALSYVASILGYGITAARYFRPQLPLAGICVAASALACYELVPRFGLDGAIWAILGSLLIQVAGSLVLCLQALKTKSDRWTP